jgi:hypothetical protein
MTKPITPRVHGLIDYGLAAANLLVPRLLGLSPRARGLFRAFGLIQGGLNAVTVQPVAAAGIVPFSVHGAIERNSGVAYLAAPIAVGVLSEPRARTWWILGGIALVTVYALTDWDAKSTGR